MIKPEWGLKRTCQSCSVRFYDLQKSSITCPHCGSAFEAVVSHRGRKSKQLAVEKEGRTEPVVPLEVDVPESLDGLLLEDEDLLESDLTEVLSKE
jgi:uncharacterized protein (TIGR02300 family)